MFIKGSLNKNANYKSLHGSNIYSLYYLLIFRRMSILSKATQSKIGHKTSKAPKMCFKDLEFLLKSTFELNLNIHVTTVHKNILIITQVIWA